jgi:hypothetical protein
MLATTLHKKTVVATQNNVLAGSASAGYDNGTGGAATFSTAASNIAVDGNNVIYVADSGNNAIRAVTPLGVVTTFAGSLSGTAGSNNATGTSATFNAPNDLSIDSNNNIYVADSGNSLVRKITSSAVVSTLFSVMNVRNVYVSPDGSNIVAVQGDYPGSTDTYGPLHLYIAGAYVGMIDPDPSTHIFDTFPVPIAATGAVILSGASPYIFYTTKSGDRADLYQATPVSLDAKTWTISNIVSFSDQGGGTYTFRIDTTNGGSDTPASFYPGQMVDILGYSRANQNLTSVLITNKTSSNVSCSYTFSYDPTASNWTATTQYIRTYVETVTWARGSVEGGSSNGGYMSNLKLNSNATLGSGIVSGAVVGYTFTAFSAGLSSNGQTSGVSTAVSHVTRVATDPIDVLYMNTPALYKYRSTY